ncbi:MAG TPA: hypothetical protein DDZ88_17655 [Verrucomicrobiales bacterium]|nr:hypothetical protein [Verrucomicrobiales bacterium]
MFLKLLSWLFYGAAILPTLVFVMTITGAERTAKENREQRQDLLNVAAVVEGFRQKHAYLPSKGEFNELTSDLCRHRPWQYELLTTQPSAERGFRLSNWSADEAQFAIRYWRGEWDEFYDSKSRQTTLDDTSEASFWIKDSLIFGWIGLGCACSGWLTARVRKKQPSRRLERD